MGPIAKNRPASRHGKWSENGCVALQLVITLKIFLNLNISLVGLHNIAVHVYIASFSLTGITSNHVHIYKNDAWKRRVTFLHIFADIKEDTSNEPILQL